MKGHFLSKEIEIIDMKLRMWGIPMYVPFIASLGVLNPNPTSLNHRLSFVATFLVPGRRVRKITAGRTQKITDHGL